MNEPNSGTSGRLEAAKPVVPPATGGAGSAPAGLSEAQLTKWGLAVRDGTCGLAHVIAKVRQSIYAAGIRGLEADRMFDAAMRQVIHVASGGQ